MVCRPAAENADAVLVGIDAGERLGIVAVDIDCDAILAYSDAFLGLLAGIGNGCLDHVDRSGSLAAGGKHPLLEDFPRPVLLARNIG